MVTLPPDPPANRDEELQFASLVDDLVSQLQRGEPLDWPTLRDTHPQWISRLENLLPMMRLLAGNADSSPDRLQAPSHFSDGKQIAEFTIVRRLGKGGMGEVFEAVDTVLQRRVALKVLTSDWNQNDRARIRFENEAMAAARLKHPNIAPVYSVGQFQDAFYYTMPYIEGITLTQLCERVQRSRVSDSDDAYSADGSEPTLTALDYYPFAARLARDVAQALDAAHEAGVIHRDIKPSNVLLDTHGHVWVVDFGLAYLEDQKSLTQSGEVVGTLRYMSPERFSESDPAHADRRMDVYSVGATLYELLALEPPYGDLAQASLVKAITHRPPVSLGSLAPKVPEGLLKIVEKAMQRDPRDRYSSCREMAVDLQRFLDGQAILARRPRWSTLAVRFVQSYPLRVLGVAIGCMLLVSGGLVAWSWRDALVARDAELRSKDLFLSINRLRERRETPQSGWREINLQELQKVAAQARDESERVLVRNEWTATQLGLDFQKVQTVLDSSDIYTCAWNHDGSQLAVGLNLAEDDGTCLKLFEGATLRQTHAIRLPTPRELGFGNETVVGIRSMHYTSDGKKLVIGTRTGMLHVLNAESGRLLQSQRWHQRSVLGLCLSPDGRNVATGGQDGWVRVGALEDLTLSDGVSLGTEIKRVFWNESDLTVLAYDLLMIPLAEGRLQEANVLHAEKITFPFASALSPFPYIVLPTGQGLRVHDTRNGQIIRTFHYPKRDFFAETSDSNTVCLNATRNSMFSTDRSGMRVWDYGSGELQLQIPFFGSSSNGVVAHPRLDQIAVWGDRRLEIYDRSPSQVFGTSPGRAFPLQQIALNPSPNAPFPIVDFSPVSERSDHELVYREMVSFPSNHGKDLGPAIGFPWVCNISNEGFWSSFQETTLVGFSHSNLHFAAFDVAYAVPVWRTQEHHFVRRIALSPKGNQLFVALNEPIQNPGAGVRSSPVLRVLSPNDWTQQWEWRYTDSGNPTRPLSILDLQFHEANVVGLFDDGTIRKWNLQSGALESTINVPFENVLAFCLIGDVRFAIGTRSGQIGVYDAKESRLVGQARLHSRPVTAIQHLDVGTLLSASIDGSLVFSKPEHEDLTERLRIQFPDASIDQLLFDSNRQLAWLRCRGEHLARWIQIGELRERLVRLGVDW